MHTSVYDASPPRGSDSSSAQTHHGAASAAQSPAGAAAHMEKGGASERTPAARELGTGELGTARVVLASDTSRKSKTTMNGMTIVNSGSHHDTASAAQTPDAAHGSKSGQPVGGAKKFERGKNWTTESSAVSVLATEEANEHAADQAYVHRAAHAAVAYKRIALDVAQDPKNNKYGIKASNTWVANVAQDIADRTSASAAANAKKGHTSRILRQADVMRTTCNNTINGIYKEVLSPEGQIPTGKQAADVVQAVREGLYKVENPTRFS